MRLLRTLVSVGVVSVIATTGIVASQESASAYHKTNKPEVQRDLENDGLIVIYSKEFSHAEYMKLAAVIAADVAVSKGGATTAYFESFAISSLEQIISNAAKKAPSIVGSLRKDLTVNKLLSAIRASFNGKQVGLSVAGVRLEVGRATYNRAECLKMLGREKCTSTPNTYQPYIRFRVN